MESEDRWRLDQKKRRMRSTWILMECVTVFGVLDDQRKATKL